MRIPEKLYLTITSYPERIAEVAGILRSFDGSTILPDRIIVNLCNEDFPNLEKDLPQDLNDYISEHPNAEIYWYLENYRSWKKHVHVLDIADDEDLIVCIDDDAAYPEDFIEKLYMSYCFYEKKHPISQYGGFFDNIFVMNGQGSMYSKRFLPRDYKRYITQALIRMTNEDFYLTCMFALTHTLIFPAVHTPAVKENPKYPYGLTKAQGAYNAFYRESLNVLNGFFDYKVEEQKVKPGIWALFKECMIACEEECGKFPVYQCLSEHFFGEKFLHPDIYDGSFKL